MTSGAISNDDFSVQVKISSPYFWKDSVVPWIIEMAPPNTKSIMILVPFKKNNQFLRQTCNVLAEVGYSMYIHGVDVPSTKNGKQIIVSSYHSAKGGEADVVVVLDAGRSSEPNPLHVAFTRSRKKMLVVASPTNIYFPLAELIQCERYNKNSCLEISERDAELVHEYICAETASEIDVGIEKEVSIPDASPAPSTIEDQSDAVLLRERIPKYLPKEMIEKDLTQWFPLGRESRTNSVLTMKHKEISYRPSITMDDPVTILGNDLKVSHIYLKAALFKTEFQCTKDIEFLKYMLDPVKKRRREEEVHSTLSSGMREHDLLPPFALKVLDEFRSKPPSKMKDFVTIAVLACLFGQFHNQTNLLLPIYTWYDEEVAISTFNTVRRNVYHAKEFQTFSRLNRKDNLSYKAKYDMKIGCKIYQFVYEDEVSHSLLCNKSIPAALAGSQSFFLLNVKSGKKMEYVFPQGRDAFLSAVCL